MIKSQEIFRGLGKVLIIVFIFLMTGCSNMSEDPLVTVESNETTFETSSTIETNEEITIEEMNEFEVINLSFGEIFRYEENFEIEIRDELLFVFYEAVELEYFENQPASKYFYIPVILRALNPGDKLDWRNWESENSLLQNTVVYDPVGNNANAAWKELARDNFPTIMGITHLHWLRQHHTEDGVHTTIRAEYSGDGEYTLQFYFDKLPLEEDMWPPEFAGAFSLPINVTWPETYMTVTTERVTRQAYEVFQVGNFQVKVESAGRFASSEYIPSNTFYFPITVINTSNVDVHLSSIEPVTFAQNGSNPIFRIYFAGESVHISNLLPLSPDTQMSFELPIVATTCGAGMPYRNLHFAEMIEDLDHHYITIRYHSLLIDVFRSED